MAAGNDFDPSILFEKTPFWRRSRPTDPYPTDKAELDALATRKKPISMYSWTREFLETRDYKWLVKQVLDRGLMLVVDPDEPKIGPVRQQGVHGFILHHDQAWRIPALRALRETAFEGGRWSYAAEAQVSLLLGYTKAERAVWLAQQRWRQAGWGCVTVYMLLTAEQRARVATLGQRSLDLETPITLFRHARLHLLKKNAAALLPKQLTLARFGLERVVGLKLFGPRARSRTRHHVSFATIAAPTLNSALRSNVQLLGAKGWR